MISLSPPIHISWPVIDLVLLTSGRELPKTMSMDRASLLSPAGVDVAFVPDMRFPNEADLVKEMGGYNVRIIRPGLDDGDGHASEHALDNYQGWDSEILNDGDLAALEHAATIMLGRIAWAHTSAGKRI